VVKNAKEKLIGCTCIDVAKLPELKVVVFDENDETVFFTKNLISLLIIAIINEVHIIMYRECLPVWVSERMEY